MYWADGCIRRTGHNPPRGPSAGWWVLTTANAAGTNGLACFPKHEGARDIKCLVTITHHADPTQSFIRYVFLKVKNGYFVKLCF
jgi:hypothetical protein